MAHYLTRLPMKAEELDTPKDWQAAEPTRAGKTSRNTNRAMA